jgi:hypothetical protein
VPPVPAAAAGGVADGLAEEDFPDEGLEGRYRAADYGYVDLEVGPEGYVDAGYWEVAG